MLTSSRTVEAYALGVRQFTEHAIDQAISLLRPGRHDAQNYVNAMLAAGRAPAGVGLKVAAAGGLYRALRWAGATEADPFRDVRIPKDLTPGIVKRPPYSEEEITDVLAEADIQDKFLIFLTAHAGLRISEALALKWSDLDEATRRVHVREGKGRKGRRVAMSSSLARASKHSRALYAPGGPEHTDGKRTTDASRVFRYADHTTARYWSCTSAA